VKKETSAFKYAKRGNDVYVWRLRKRLSFLNELEDGTFFDPHGNFKKSNVLFITLTYDVKLSSIRGAWETIGENFNRWIRNLRKKFGRISHLRCWEASKKGFPHIHVLMVFHDYRFQVARIRGKYRVLEKEAFEKSYHSFVDVQAVRKIREGIKYVTKYLTEINDGSQSQTLTLALCWLFRKRSFAVSEDFQESMQMRMKNSGRIMLIQIDLQGMKIRMKVEWGFIGVFSAQRLGIDRNEWRKIITDREVLRDILR
jgi:hypothetical protein